MHHDSDPADVDADYNWDSHQTRRNDATREYLAAHHALRLIVPGLPRAERVAIQDRFVRAARDVQAWLDDDQLAVLNAALPDRQQAIREDVA